jgi:hypothetical protein
MSKASDPIDAKLDGWLADWPAPERDDGAWENFGSKLDERLAGLEIGQGEEAWLEAPLPAEPGEGNSDNAVFEAGGASMSEPESDKPKKKSLKDFAQRVSVTPPTPSEAKSTESPIPKAGETPMPVSGPRGSSPSLRASASFVSRPPEARDSDSGIVDLNAVRKSAASIPDTGAQPGENGLFDDEAKVAVPVKVPPKKSSAVPIIGGGLVAVLALAAAAVLVVRSSGQADMSAAEAPMVAAASAPAEQAEQAEPAAQKARAAASGLSAEGLELAAASDAGAPREEPAAPGKSASEHDEPKTAAAKTDDKKAKADEKTDKEPADPKDLAGAMATAVGDNGTSKDDDGKKAAGPSVDPGSIPESPSQGAIQGAIGSVKGAAKGCVAGMDEPSRATITFASNGTVSSVSVSGGASGKPAASCIQSALKRARVGPFKRSSFTVGVTLRP